LLGVCDGCVVHHAPLQTLPAPYPPHSSAQFR
jgi:hypothetical protein